MQLVRDRLAIGVVDRHVVSSLGRREANVDLYARKAQFVTATKVGPAHEPAIFKIGAALGRAERFVSRRPSCRDRNSRKNGVSVSGPRITYDFAGMAYDAAMGKRSWQSMVEEVAMAFDAVHAVIAPHMPDRGTGRISGVCYVVSHIACGTYEGQDLLMERAWRLPRGELSAVQNMRADLFIGKSPFYKVTLDEIDIGHAVHVIFPTRRTEVGFFCVTRYSHQPAFSEDELAACATRRTSGAKVCMLAITAPVVLYTVA